nr:PREDICTED: junctional adhesion molecule B isoform X2 [Rhinolophus sinicus]
MARRSRHRLLLLLLRYLVVALGYHKAYGFSAPKDPKVVTAIEYQEVILACKYPKKTIAFRLEWKKLGPSVSFVYYQQALQGDFKDRAELIDFSIRIKNVTRNDAGNYRCEISAPSEQGQNLEEDTVTLEVLVAPAVPSCEVPNSALSGTVVELRCQDKEGNPRPEYTWFKDGVPLLWNPKLGSQSSNSSYTMNTKSGTLQFNTVSKLDSGEYSCEARNAVGHRRCPGKRMQVDNFLWIQSFLSEIPFLLRSSNKLWRIFFIAFSAVENIQDDMQVSHGANGEEKQSFLSPVFQETPKNMQEEPWSGIEQ